jgi:hypothetical protein
MANSKQVTSTKVSGAVNILKLTADSEVEYVYHYLGMTPGNSGGESIYYIQVYDNETAIDVVLEEAIDSEGPWTELDSQAAIPIGSPTTVSYLASGVFYGGVLRVGVKYAASAGSYSIKMLSK